MGLELQRRDAVAVARDDVQRGEPHTRSGSLLRCMAVPAVTEVCRWRPAHSHKPRSAAKRQPFRPSQDRHTKPSGQRSATKCSAHAASSGKRRSNSARDRGRWVLDRMADGMDSTATLGGVKNLAIQPLAVTSAIWGSLPGNH
jgi:hypothetical protein